jgi:hypothetical protein
MARLDVSWAIKRAIFEANLAFAEQQALVKKHAGAESVDELPPWLAALAPGAE